MTAITFTKITQISSNEKSFRASLDAGTLPLKPDREGFADTRPVGNPLTGRFYQGMEAVLLKAHSAAQGFSSPEFITMSEMTAAFAVMGGQDGRKKPLLNLSASGVSAASLAVITSSKTGKTAQFVNLSQIREAQLIKQYAVMKGVSPLPLPPRSSRNAALTCVSTDPAAVLGLYFAALETGRPFKITMNQYKDWSRKTSAFLNRPQPSQEKEKPLNKVKVKVIEKKEKSPVAASAPGQKTNFGKLVLNAAAAAAGFMTALAPHIQGVSQGLGSLAQNAQTLLGLAR